MIYILHIDPPFKHARHYVGFTKFDDATRRINQHLKQSGGRPSKLIAAALAAGCILTLVGTLEGDRAFERKLKQRGGASKYCPICRPLSNARRAAQMRIYRAAKKKEKLERSTTVESLGG